MEDGEDLRLTLSLKTSELSPSCAASDRSPQESTRERSDEEDGGGRKKLRLSKLQASTLEDAFKEHHTLNPKEKLALARDLNLTPRQVEVWFQNRRARKKLKKTEVDCEMLKRCCENLSEENRRLQKELMELRAIKRIPHGLCMQMGKAGGITVPPPPTTLLSICPSCERATAAGVTAEQNGSYRGSTPLPLHRRRQISPLY